MSNELCPASAPFFGFMGAAVALIFASTPLRSTNMRAAPGAGTVCALARTSQADCLPGFCRAPSPWRAPV